jgi:2,3-diaminopropionate biosynthesis protein SbnB
MKEDNIIILKGHEISALFQGRELEIMENIKLAYQTHERGNSSLPHSNFLRFPDNEKNRIIALPAYLGGDFETAGIKWISSFPDNLTLGIERASAVLILNSTETGRPIAILESSIISAKRTAASAALAANYLRGEQLLTDVGIIGCGLINFETIRFLIASNQDIENLFIYDLSQERAEQFKVKCEESFKNLKVVVVDNNKDIFQNSSVISLATTAIQPHLFDISDCRSEQTILNISLRDLSPEIILSADNIVDDIDHVCRAQTSIHLAEQYIGNRNFIRCTIGNILNGISQPRQNNKISIFSPFGLGILDLALGNLSYKLALQKNQGTTIETFFPVSWIERK